MLRALSIRSPWAYAILQLGKDVENRTWPLRQTGPLAIHVGQRFVPSEFEEALVWIQTHVGIPRQHLERLAALPRGGIAGIVDVVGCTQHSDSQWFTGAFGIEFERPQLTEFRPLRGKQGLFYIPDHLVGTVDCNFRCPDKASLGKHPSA